LLTNVLRIRLAGNRAFPAPKLKQRSPAWAPGFAATPFQGQWLEREHPLKTPALVLAERWQSPQASRPAACSKGKTPSFVESTEHKVHGSHTGTTPTALNEGVLSSLRLAFMFVRKSKIVLSEVTYVRKHKALPWDQLRVKNVPAGN
jgi:hypothetical protein